MGVSYAAVDEKVEKENPFIAGCLSPLTPVAAFGSGEEFIKLYSLTSTGGEK
jgi:2-keto-3-deoxy-6-phosphogluconate aldolase